MKNLNSPSLLITDGDCEFCQLSAAWLIKNFPGNWLNQPSQNSNLADLRLTKEEVAKQVWYLIPFENTWKKYGGAKAIFKLLLQTKNLHQAVSYFLSASRACTYCAGGIYVGYSK